MTSTAPPSAFVILSALFGLTLMITASGFRSTVYFVSIGYAFTIATLAVAIIILYGMQVTFLSFMHNLLLVAWGLRLGFFLILRKIKPGYQREARETYTQYGHVKFLTKLAIWIGVSVLYVSMVLPALFHTANAYSKTLPTPMIAQIAGLILMAGGLAIEALADHQKSAFKARFPKTFCNTGLYNWVRCPNYLGEILFWVGNWVMGTWLINNVAAWIASFASLVCLILIMVGSTRRLERTQEKRYGNLPEYQHYIQSVPVLFPFIPVYTLNIFRVYLE